MQQATFMKRQSLQKLKRQSSWHGAKSTTVMTGTIQFFLMKRAGCRDINQLFVLTNYYHSSRQITL